MSWLNSRRFWGFNTVEFFLLLAVITMPYHNNLNSYCIVAFIVIALFSNNLQEKKSRLSENKIWILPVCYFLLMALNLIWDPGPDKSMKILEKSASFIALPLILSSIRPLSKVSIRRILFLFVASVTIGALYCLWQSYLEYKSTGYINFFFYHHLSMHIGLNAIYFSLYTVFSIWILLYYTFFKETNNWIRAVTLPIIFFLLIFSVLLASKMLLAVLFASLLVVTVYSFFYIKRIRSRIIVLVLFLVCIPIILLQFPYLRSRIDDTKLLEYGNTVDKNNGLAVRTTLWKAAWKLIREKPVQGHGHFAAQHALEEEYTKAGLHEAAKEGYNSHNQYLFTWANYGIIGLLIIVAYLVMFLKEAIKQKHLLAIIFGFTFLIANLTECMMQVQKGIVFYILFSSLFLFHDFERRDQTAVATA